MSKSLLYPRDLNPLHQLTDPTDYQDKYYKNIMSIYHKYDEVSYNKHEVTQLLVCMN